MTQRPRLAALVALAALLATSVAIAPASSSTERPIGDTRVFATLPYPGQPGGIVVEGNTVWVDTFAFVFRPTDLDDRVFALQRASGHFVPDTPGRPNPIIVPRTRPVAVMGLAGMAADADGRLYVVDMNARILRIDPGDGSQEVYATFPPLDVGGPVTTMPGDLAFDAEGYAYVTDISGLPVIWRVPPGGGEAEPWFVDEHLAAHTTAGSGGIRFDASGQALYFAIGRAVHPDYHGDGVVLKLAVDGGVPGALDLVQRYEPDALPAGIAFGQSGKLYVALLGVHQMSIVSPSGVEEERFPDEPMGFFQRGLYSNPVFVAFDGRGSLLVTNIGNETPETWTVVDAFVDDVAQPLIRPDIPG